MSNVIKRDTQPVDDNPDRFHHRGAWFIKHKDNLISAGLVNALCIEKAEDEKKCVVGLLKKGIPDSKLGYFGDIHGLSEHNYVTFYTGNEGECKRMMGFIETQILYGAEIIETRLPPPPPEIAKWVIEYLRTSGEAELDPWKVGDKFNVPGYYVSQILKSLANSYTHENTQFQINEKQHFILVLIGRTNG